MKKDDGYAKLKSEIAKNELRNLYVFHGEEAYLKSHYVKQIEHIALSGGLAEMNYSIIEGRGFDVDFFSDCVESYPAMSEYRLIVVRDLDLFKLAAGVKDKIIAILSDLPGFSCVVFMYDTLEFRPDRRQKLYGTIAKAGLIVEFSRPDKSDIIPWIKRRFAAHDKLIDATTCEYMMFYCGMLITALIPEIEKVAAYASRREIKNTDIEAVCVKTVEAEIYNLTDEIARRRFDRALLRLRDLFYLKNDPIRLLSAIARQFSRLYGARLALNEGKGVKYVMELAGYRSSYPAEKLLDSARGVDLPWIRQAILICARVDERLKSTSADKEDQLYLMLMEIAAI